MWAEMLKASLTPKAQEQVVIYKDEYEVQTAAGGQKNILAPAYYKVIMRLTTYHSRHQDDQQGTS
jgi:hypothetical protein